MSLNIALQNALTGLAHSQTALQVTSNNVSNVNTAGFTKKSIQSISQLVAGQGRGVFSSDITRAVNVHLQRDVFDGFSDVGKLTILNQLNERVQDFFGSPESSSSFTATLASLASRMEAVALAPEDPTARDTMISTAVQMARQLNDMADHVQDLRKIADAEISTSVDTINTELQRIADLNNQIQRNKLFGLPYADLQDKRDTAVGEVAKQMDVSYFVRDTGELVLQTRSGNTLVDGVAKTLTHDPAASLSASVTYPAGIDGISLNGVDLTTDIQGGRLKGLIDMRDTELPQLNSQIDNLALQLRDQMNAIHNDGAGYPAANSLTGTRAVTGADAFSGTGTVRIAVIDADGNAVAAPFDFDLAALGATNVTAVAAAIDAGLGAAGSASVTNGRLVVTAANGAHGIAINESSSDVSGRGFSHYFGLNDFFVGDETVSLANQIAVRSDIVADPQLVSRGELGTGVINVGENAVAAGDNSVVQRLAGLFSTDVSFAAAGGLPALSVTFSDYSAQILSTNASAAAEARESLEITEFSVGDLQLRLSSESGVNIDEELAELVVLQNAYSASARVVSVTTELMDILNQLVG